jgi:hypothetical protein
VAEASSNLLCKGVTREAHPSKRLDQPTSASDSTFGSTFTGAEIWIFRPL